LPEAYGCGECTGTSCVSDLPFRPVALDKSIADGIFPEAADILEESPRERVREA